MPEDRNYSGDLSQNEKSVLHKLRDDALNIAKYAINEMMPEKKTQSVLERISISGDVYVLAVGKAAWKMAKAARETLEEKYRRGIVITKYGHDFGEIADSTVYEAGHPVVDERSLKATAEALKLADSLGEDDCLLFLLSGGGSALFEYPVSNVELGQLQSLTDQLLSSGADIVEMNTIRKRLSAVKGGRFAERVAPAKIITLILSDVIGDKIDTIASGPCCVDESTDEDVLRIIQTRNLEVDETVWEALHEPLPRSLTNVETTVIGSLNELCNYAKSQAESLGYKTFLMTSSLQCEARDAGSFLAAIARGLERESSSFSKPCALILGGETVVNIRGNGKGGRNQELALSAAIGMKDLQKTVLLSVGSDGTDGPTDAAGGIVDGFTVSRMQRSSYCPMEVLKNNDSYHGLLASGDLVKTGPTGTNVNDLIILLSR